MQTLWLFYGYQGIMDTFSYFLWLTRHNLNILVIFMVNKHNLNILVIFMVNRHNLNILVTFMVNQT